MAETLFWIVQPIIEKITNEFEPTEGIANPCGKIFGMLLEDIASESQETKWLENEDLAALFELKVIEAAEVLSCPKIGLLKKKLV